MYDLGIFGLKNDFFLNTLLKVLWEGISSPISFDLTIINSNIISRQFLGPSNLFGAQAFYIHEVTEVIVVH